MMLTEFLLARIAEDEDEIGHLAAGERDEGAGPNGIGWAEVGAIREVLMVSQARALAECKAKRAIIGLAGEQPHVFAEALRWMAEVYADHPDYDQARRA